MKKETQVCQKVLLRKPRGWFNKCTSREKVFFRNYSPFQKIRIMKESIVKEIENLIYQINNQQY